jgi:hypothetical protein
MYVQFIPTQNLSHSSWSPCLCFPTINSLTFEGVKFWVKCSLTMIS